MLKYKIDILEALKEKGYTSCRIGGIFHYAYV